MTSLKNKVVIITGAGRGVGKSISQKLAAEGTHLVLVSRTESEINALAKTLEKEHGIKSLTVPADVSLEEDVQVVRETLNHFGTVDVLINNAGVGKYGPLEEMSVQDYDIMMNTNMRSTFLFCKAVLPIMKSQKVGRSLTLLLLPA